MITPVILAGGSGTRLWPLSRQLKPKQFLRLTGDSTMFQQTLQRLEGLPCNAPIVVCSEEHRFLVAEQLREMGQDKASIILEPVPKNTASAIALAANYSKKERDTDSLLLILPADHLIAEPKSFRETILNAIAEAEDGRLVTFGITPTRPETGYGYIRKGQLRGNNCWSVASFTEKPDEKTAKQYIESGEYWWNGGMFLFLAESFLEELYHFAPDIYKTCTRAMNNAMKDLFFLWVDKKEFESLQALSIDYAVMEKTEIASVVPLASGWSDIGSWNSLWEVCEKNDEGNAIQGDVKIIKAQDCLIRAESRLVAAIGVENLVVVETKDAVLVAHRDHAQKIRDLVEDVRSNGYPKASEADKNAPYGELPNNP